MAGVQSHAQTWDGRIFIAARNDAASIYWGAWHVSVFRPEHLVTGADGTPVFSSIEQVNAGAAPEISQSVIIESESSTPSTTSGQILHSALAIVPDPDFGTNNPFPANASCGAEVSGSHACYRMIIFAQGHYHSACNGFGQAIVLRKAQVVVANPGTAQASIASAAMLPVDTSGAMYQVLTITGTGAPLCGIEPTVTADGRLLMFQGPWPGLQTTNNSVLSYTFNPAGPVAAGWRGPGSIANLYHVDRDYDLGGKTVGQRYPLARQPLRDASGNVFPVDAVIRGAYPWLSLSGEDLVYTATTNDLTPDADPATPGNPLITQRAGMSVIGVSTGHAARHIDGPLNPDRETTPRLFTSSPGGLPSLWAPYPGARGSKLPYYPTRPVLPIFSTNLILGQNFYSAYPNTYAEVSYEPFEDGNYLLYLPMNEMVTSAGDYNIAATPDISGNFNNGTLQGAAFPLEQTGVDQALIGAHGQAIYFSSNGSVVVNHSHGAGIPGRSLALGEGFSFHMWVNPLVQFGSDGGNHYQVLAHKPGVFVLFIEGPHTLLARVFVGGQQRELRMNATAPVGQWTAVGFTYDGRTGSLTGHANGQVVGNTIFGPGNVDQSTNPLVIGPGSQTPAPPYVAAGAPLMLIDEVALSNKVRTNLEMLRASHRRPNVTLPAGLSVNELGPAPPPTDTTLIELGRDLFFDKRLSSNQQVSCASCHLPDMLFGNGQVKGQGIGTTPLHVPVTFNRALSSRQTWDGRSPSLEQQAALPLTGPLEMGNDLSVVAAAVNYIYGATFTQLFGGPATPVTISQALAAYQRTLLSGNSAADQFAAGNDSALTAAQRRGRALFFGKGRCAGCHSGSNYTDERFHNTGLTADPAPGRQAVTGSAFDLGAWKTPTLRDVAQTAPYLHDGSIATLQAVVEAYNTGGLSTVANKSAEIRPLNLTTQEVADLVAFLGALTGTTLDKTAGTPPVGAVQVPQGLSPTGSFADTVGRTTLSWNPVPGATSYRLTVEDLTDGTLRDLRSFCTDKYLCLLRADNKALVVIRPGHQYKWSVEAIVGNLVSAPATANLSVPAGAPPACNLQTLAADLSDAGAVEYAYCLIFHRQSDEAGKASGLSFLSTPSNTRADLAVALMMSAESTAEYETTFTDEQFARALFRQLMMREGEANGVANTVQFLQSNTREAAARAFVLSAEFCEKHPPLRTAACP